MTLTKNGKDYIAKELGIGNCFASSGMKWTAVAQDDSSTDETGGTASIVGRLVTTSVYKRIDVTSPRIKSYTYAGLKSANDNTDVVMTDASWVAANDGNPSTEPKYCFTRPPPCGNYGDVDYDGYVTMADAQLVLDYVGGSKSLTADQKLRADVNGDGVVDISDVTDMMAYVNGQTNTFLVCPTPTPTPTPSPDAPAGTFVFVTAPTGIPTVSLDLGTLVMKQAADYHFEMNSISIKNTSSWRIYLAMEVKLFAGIKTTCPVTGFVFDGLDREQTVDKNIRIKTLEPGVLGTYNGDFFQPLTIAGVHTVCLLIHGAWTKAELEAEIAPITG